MRILGKLSIMLMLIALVLAGCASQAAPTATLTAASKTAPTDTAVEPGQTAAPTSSGNPASLTVMTHDSFLATQSVIAAFESQNHVKVTFIKSGDGGAALNRAILSNGAPIADVFYGVDNTFLSRALESGIYEAYN